MVIINRGDDMTLIEELKDILKSDEKLVSNGQLLKNLIVELALKLDKDLIKLLLKNNKIKEHFFIDIDGILVFDKEKFMKFIDNKDFLPDSYTVFKKRIGLITDTGKYINNSKEVVLAWPYKDCILEGGQEKTDEKRNEIFYNEILAPDEIDRLLDSKVFTKFKRIDKNGEHEVDDVKPTDNLIIKGNNLLVLYSLKKKLFGKVKLIYIDPPYNTGNDDFKYNDNLNHSTWLTFMKNRLEVARNLLRDDGSIFISLDDTESAYCKIIADSIFNRENYLSTIAYQRSGAAGLGQGGKFVIKTAESILVYAKDKTKFNAYNLEGGVPLEFKHMKRYNSVLEHSGNKKLLHTFKSKSTGEDVNIYKHSEYKISTISLANFYKRKNEIMSEYTTKFDKIFRLNIPQIENEFQHNLIKEMPDDGLYSVEYLVNRGKNKNKVVINYYYKKQLIAWLNSSAIIKNGKIIKTNKLTDFWAHEDIPKADLANEGGVTLLRGKKPEHLLYRIIDMASLPGDLVLDFFVGSGTTCAVAHKMGRQYIGVEQLDYGKNDSVIRLKNVINGDRSGISKAVNWQGGGEFVYCELMKLNEVFMEKIQEAKNGDEILTVWDNMKQKGFLSYRVDPALFDKNIEDFKALKLEEQKKLLIELLDKNELYVNYSEIDDGLYDINRKDEDLNRKFYGDL